MSLYRDVMPSPNQSGRGGSGVTRIVLHTAEGALTYQALGNYFASPSAQVSSHVGIDDTPGVVGEYVGRHDKAWTAGDANPWSVQAELCAFAGWGPAEWDAHPTMLENAAAWIAEEAAAFGIPLDLLDDGAAQNAFALGVCQHEDLGAMGGGHWDCGPDFPIGRVLDMARGDAPTTSPQPEDDESMILFIRAENDPAVYRVVGDLSSRVHMPSESAIADSAWAVRQTGGKVSWPPKGAAVENIGGEIVWVASPAFVATIPVAK